MGERATEMTDELDITGRVRVLEHSVHKLEHLVETRFTQMDKSIGRIAETLSNHRPAIPFKEIAATVAVCLAIIAYVGNYLEGQHAKNIRLIEYRLEQLEKRGPPYVMIPGLQAQRQ